MNDMAEPAFSFDETSEALIPSIIAKYPEGKQASAVMPLLDLAQRQMARQTGHAWVPRTAMDVIARRLSMPSMRVYEVATFYTMFHTKPVGRYHLQVCTTTPCWLRGSDEVMASCRKAAEADGEMFSIEEVECLGCCVNAPVVQVNDDVYEDLDGPRTEDLLARLRAGDVPPRGSMIGRQNSAPEGGPTTLFNVGGGKQESGAE
ncbi:MAG TPA: NAD(P)H-dependent oxidoreductase subunit E [Acidiphilium sp.]|uniref:complex I 24 kDa subunit family protein n=1 Tax=unclassified Acidiphilium TaxID=2617493 RepID=UPI000BDA01B0|nr:MULTISPECIES: NAD(P)H-dependent oxidoreductase subunit E [unclassified Acidiphilium]OYV57511.1 MAG: NAD(P)H-dependent oxidoreductase subunit E [Acidiphilium sp. 20-67-58]HQT59613.1 NAD(P)H-dependent oxidoreductase subunit E [Acidiphilium sp.]HQU10292.1 NAD(P)H-dependent oxidoreductase subunit E [Acidiphilium sp.]